MADKIASLVIILLIVSIAGALMFGLPHYLVWQKGKAGQAQLMEARQNRQIMIEEASARLESSKLNAQAEVERAKGMAEAMAIENMEVTPEYNQYLFIRSLETIAEHGSLPQIIYLPTDGLLPVMDLGQHGQSR